MKLYIRLMILFMVSTASYCADNYLEGAPITFDAHFHYRELNDGLFDTPGECELSETDIASFYEECELIFEKTNADTSEDKIKECVDGKIKEYKENPDRYCEAEFNYSNLLESEKFDNVEKINLISNSCMINFSREINEWERLKSNIEGIHDHVSSIHEKYPNRVIGSCGAELTWPIGYLEKELKRCLSLPGMKGIKLHVPHNNHKNHVLNIDVLKKVHRIFKLANSVNGFVLWHLDMHNGKNEESKKFNHASLNIVLRMLDKYSDLSLIIPHALHSVDAFKMMNDIEEKLGKRKNLYLDITHVERNLIKEEYVVDEDNETYVKKDVRTEDFYRFKQELSRFGINRVLYATDNFYYRENTNQLGEILGLTQEEQLKIRTENGAKFLKRILKEEK